MVSLCVCVCVCVCEYLNFIRPLSAFFSPAHLFIKYTHTHTHRWYTPRKNKQKLRSRYVRRTQRKQELREIGEEESRRRGALMRGEGIAAAAAGAGESTEGAEEGGERK